MSSVVRGCWIRFYEQGISRGVEVVESLDLDWFSEGRIVFG